MLNSLQKDALTEILNINFGASASLLSDMLGRRLILSAPIVNYKQGSDYNLHMDSHSTVFVMTSLAFNSKFSGKTHLILPKENARLLIQSCLGEEYIENAQLGLYKEEMDVFKEISNVILNTFVGELGNLLDETLNYHSLNTIHTFDFTNNISSAQQVLEFKTSFFLLDHQINGVILLALSLSSFNILLEKIDILLEGL